MEQTGLPSVGAVWELGFSAGVLHMHFYIYSLLNNVRWIAFIIVTFSVYSVGIKAIVIVINFS